MKLKTIALAVLLAANGTAFAAPTMQTCTPMEVTHNGNSGLSYSLSCDAGGWSLKYTGSVPAGTESVLARYRVQVSNSDGTSFLHNRSVRLPSPSLLGQALIREAILLDNGGLALRDCEEFSCTLYRPVGAGSPSASEKVVKATITVTPEIKRLTEEATRLNAELAKRQSELDAQNQKVAALQREVSTLTSKLGGTEQTLSNAKAALENAKEQYAADIDGLLKSTKAESAGAAAAAAAQSATQIAKLNEQLTNVSGALDAARKELAECAAAHDRAEEAKANADVEVAARTQQVAALQASLKAADAELKRVLDGVDAKMADLADKQTQSEEVAALQLKLDAATAEVENLLAKVVKLENSLDAANQQLATAKAAQVAHTTVLSDAADSQERQRAVLEIALAEAQLTIAELTTARATQVGELQSALADANLKLKAAQSQLADVATRPVQPAGADSELASATARIDELVNKVAGLETALEWANHDLTEAKRVAGAQEAAYADLSAAYENNLQELATQHTAAGPVQAPQGGELAKALAERDAALANVAKLTADLAAIGPQVDKLEADRLATMKDAQLVAKQMLEALDMVQDLQTAKAEADKTIESTTAKLMEMSTKVEAANLARGLAMQAATTANADADTQNLKNRELAQRLVQSGQQLQAAQAESNALASELEKAKADLAAATQARGDGADVAPLQANVQAMRQERDELTAEVARKQQRIGALESTNADQAREIAALRKQLSEARAVPVAAPGASEYVRLDVNP